jgi:hypothetical protein
MIDVKNAKSDLTRKERNFIKGMEERGFSGKLVRKYTHVTRFKLIKSGITFEYDIIGYSRLSMKKWLENLEERFQMLKDLMMLDEEIKAIRREMGALKNGE